MSNSTKQSLEDFLKELGKKRQNWKYPVIVAFDRTTANHVLKQEFIEHYTEGEFIPPLTSEIDLDPGISYHKLLDFCLDEPRLSFENADLSDSRAKLLMRTVRGKQIQLSQASGSTRRRVSKLAEATPINGPTLVFDVELKGSNAQISEEGEVYFNIATGKNYTFHGGVTEFKKDKLGEHFSIYFASLRPRKIQYTLGKLSNLENSTIKPEKFAIRTHGGPGSTLRNEESFGDGAVVLFVEIEGFDSKDAVPPDENSKLTYLLPDDLSASVMINRTLVMDNFIFPALKSSNSLLKHMEWKLMSAAAAKDFEYMAVGNGWVDSVVMAAGPWRFVAAAHNYYAPTDYNATQRLRIAFKDDKLVITWVGNFNTPAEILNGNDRERGALHVEWDVRHEYAFSVDSSGDSDHIVLSRVGGHENSSVRLSGNLDRYWDDYISHILKKEAMYAEAEKFLANVTSSANETLRSVGANIDTFILSSLLFRNSKINLEYAHWPNDVMALGQLAPDRNKLTITRSDNTPIDNGETSILSGTALTFKTTPATEGVTWSVRHIPDYEGENPTGTIDPATGAYSAPAADKFEGSHIKVIVTAKKGTAVSHVLVSVLRTTVNAYPTVMTVNLDSYGDIIGGEMNGQTVNWQVKGLGRIEDNPTPDPLAQASKRYYSPKEVPDFEASMPAVDEVMRLDQVVVSNGASSKTVHILLPVETQAAYWLKPVTAGASVKLEFWFKPRGKPEQQVAADDTSWYVRIGNGTIEDGVYTPHASKPDEDCIVIVAIDESQMTIQYASIIVPIPFIDAEQFVSLYESVEASDKARRLRLNQK
ncbi:hypothetical protein [Pseudomonas putida]|uniref:hypothetical protein n=1 Tax=Pseudomonas putida TaxID=303 RepID=UPI0021F84196|nr:hypothetical protein [Pseudomonas putida]